MKSLLGILILAALVAVVPAAAQPNVYTSNTIGYYSYSQEVYGTVRTTSWSWDPDLYLYVEGSLQSPDGRQLRYGSSSSSYDASVDLYGTATGPGVHTLNGTHYYTYQGMSYYLPGTQDTETVPGSTAPPSIYFTNVNGSPWPGGSGSIDIYGSNLASCFGPTDISIVGISTWGASVDCDFPSSASVNYSIPSYYTPGSYWLDLRTPYGWASTQFSVGETPYPPSVGGIIILGPTTPGSSGYVEIYGSDLAKYAGQSSVSISDVNTSVTYQNPNNPNQINIWYSIPAYASPGPRTLVVTTPYGSDYYNSFTVTQP